MSFLAPYQRALVVGLARSGVAAARLLRAQGLDVVATDARGEEALGSNAKLLREAGVELRCGAQDAELHGADLVVTSPGVPLSAAPLKAARSAGVPLWPEVELGWLALQARREVPTVAITGTNGKSTVAELCGAMARAAGREAIVAGNVGRPMSDYALAETLPELLVLELSSYQLELTAALAPRVAMILNISPDHLERHGDLQTYAAAKARIFAGMGEGTLALLPAGDALLSGLPLPAGVDRVLLADTDADAAGREYQLDNPRLRGPHNAINVAFAAQAMRRLDIGEGVITQALRDFPGLPHRLELVGRFGDAPGIQVWNDSKATNVDAARRAIETLKGPPTVLVAGGVPKQGDDLDAFARVAADNGVRAVALVGRAAPLLAVAFKRADIPRVDADPSDFAAAVQAAAGACEPGDQLLLAPACASFDQFSDFEARGDAFAEVARAAFASEESGS